MTGRTIDLQYCYIFSELRNSLGSLNLQQGGGFEFIITCE